MTTLQASEERFFDEIRAELAASGIQSALTPEGALRAELPDAGRKGSVVYFAPLRSLVTGFATVAECMQQLDDKQDLWLQNEIDRRTATELTLLLVAESDLLSIAGFARICTAFEHNMHYAKKNVCFKGDLNRWVVNTFGQPASSPNKLPVLTCVDEIRPFQTPVVNTATVEFDPETLFDMLNQLTNSSKKVQYQRQVAILTSRILGGTCQVEWDDSGEPVLGKIGDSFKRHLAYESPSTRLAVALCVFLVLEQEQASDSACIGFSSVFNPLDTLQHLGAMKCLRDFVAATGACVFYRSNKSSYRDMAKYKLKHCMTVIAPHE